MANGKIQGPLARKKGDSMVVEILALLIVILFIIASTPLSSKGPPLVMNDSWTDRDKSIKLGVLINQ